MEVGAKLQLKPGTTVFVASMPVGVELDLPAGVAEVMDFEAADAVIVFVLNKGEFVQRIGPAFGPSRSDRLTWVAYPKAGQLGTDLNRDRLVALMSEFGVQPVRQVAIDETWSALRFRPL